MKHDPPIETSTLYNFVIIAESDSLTSAAKRLGVSQPAISQSLKQIEKVLDAELVIRRSNPIKLTPAGIVLKKNADTILGELRRLKFSVREAAKKGMAHCRIGAMTSYSEVFGSKFITNLKQKTELLTLQSGSTPALNKAFLNRELDILISDDPLKGEEEIDRFKLFRDPLVFVYQSEIPSREYQTPLMLSKQTPMIKYSKNTNMGTLTEIALRRMELTPKVKFETDDTHTLMRFVKDDHGWAITSCLCLLQTQYQLNKIKVMELDQSRHCRTIYMLARKNELGLLPEKTAKIAKDLFFKDIYSDLRSLCPWAKPSIFTN